MLQGGHKEYKTHSDIYRNVKNRIDTQLNAGVIKIEDVKRIQDIHLKKVTTALGDYSRAIVDLVDKNRKGVLGAVVSRQFTREPYTKRPEVEHGPESQTLLDRWQ